MKRRIWLIAALIAAASVGAGLLAIARGPEWTTTSVQALAEYEAAEQAWMKLYYADAVTHLRRAIELDPGFVVAKLHLLDLDKQMPKEQREQLLQEVLAADLDLLNTRERFLVERLRARVEDRFDVANQLLDSYLEAHPNDPYVLDIKSREEFNHGDPMTAETFARRLVEVSPNWVRGYNLLGYITMLQGRFSEADEYFTSYRFIAPDQANPHDSLGELYLIRGAYDDAVASFEQALTIKPDFPGSYAHLVGVHLARGDYQAAGDAIRRAGAAEVLPAPVLQYLECTVEYNRLAHGGAWQQILEQRDSSCFDDASPTDAAYILTHRAAVQLGQLAIARELEQVAAEWCTAEKKGKMFSYGLDPPEAAWFHLQGVRLVAEGHFDDAVARFERADQALTYIESGVATFKLYNRLLLADALAAAGQQQQASELREQVQEVNSRLAERYQDRALITMSLTF